VPSGDVPLSAPTLPNVSPPQSGSSLPNVELPNTGVPPVDDVTGGLQDALP
jgi:hypothetical protein